MKQIPLTKGKFALVDDEDFEFLSQWNWYFDRYATRNERVGNMRRKVLMHRVIMRPARDKEVDHINGDKLDNRKANLRLCNKSQNQANRRKSINTSSIYKGVARDKKAGRWRSQIFLNEKLVFIGMFDSERHAALAYDIWMLDLFGSYARTNFNAVSGS